MKPRRLDNIKRELCAFWITSDPWQALYATILVALSPFQISFIGIELMRNAQGETNFKVKSIITTCLFVIFFLLFLFRLFYLEWRDFKKI